MNWNEYRTGVSRGLPVGMGYFSVSFGFGAMAVSQGLNAWNATLISLTNLTSAGQFAGLTVIVAAATLAEMVLTQLIINSRYALMSLALSQRMGQRIGFLPRLAIAFFNTDEIFALGMAREGKLKPAYFLGAGAYFGEFMLLTDCFTERVPHQEMFMAYCFGPLYLLLGMSYLLGH